MIVLTAVFMFQCVNDVYIKSPFDYWMAMTLPGLQNFWVWQFFTFQFLHADLWHLAGNVLTLWFIGRYVEQCIGSRRFLAIYLICGFGGGLLQAILMLLLPQHFGVFMYGASAGTTGIFAIFALLVGSQTIRLNFILPVRADVLLWIITGISVFFTLVPTQREACVAHAAHLGGIITAFIAVRRGWLLDYAQPPWERLWSSLTSRSPMKTKPAPKQKKREPLIKFVRDDSDEEADSPDFISKKVDPILDKIREKGIHSLTDKERKILEKAQGKLSGK